MVTIVGLNKGKSNDIRRVRRLLSQNKNKKKQVKEILLNWLKTELTSIPQKNYQKVIHNELVLQDERIVPKNKQGENLLSSLLRITSILEEKEFETWAGGNVKPKDFIHA